MRLRGLFLIVFTFLAFTANASEQALDKVVAVVNSDVITQSELNHKMLIAKEQMLAANMPVPSGAALEQKVLNQLIDTKLQLQMAKRAKITVSDDDVTQAISQIAARNGMTVQQLQDKITTQQLSYADYRNEIKTEMLISEVDQAAVAGKISISDQDVNNAIRTLHSSASAAQSNANLQYHIIDILIPIEDNPTVSDIQGAEQKANALDKQLRQSHNLQTALENNPDAQATDLGFRALNQLPDLFSSAIPSLSKGDFSAPIHAPNGYHILNLVATQSASPQNPLNYQAAPSLQTNVNLILIKKNPLFTDAEMQIHLQDIRKQAVASNDFAKVAENNSEDAKSADKGGSLGWINPGTLPLPVETQMTQLKPGDVSQPIAYGDDYYIVQVVARRQMTDKNQALRDQARQLVYQQKYADALQNWIQQLRNQSYVKTYT